MEELGIKASSLELVGKCELPLLFAFKTPKIYEEGKEYVGSERYFFRFRFIGDESEIALQEEEVRVYKWVPFTELGMYLLFDDQLEETVGKIREVFHQ